MAVPDSGLADRAHHGRVATALTVPVGSTVARSSRPSVAWLLGAASGMAAIAWSLAAVVASGNLDGPDAWSAYSWIVDLTVGPTAVLSGLVVWWWRPSNRAGVAMVALGVAMASWLAMVATPPALRAWRG